MRYRFFTISIYDQDQAENELNSFLSQHRIVNVEKQFIADGGNSLWSFCVEWLEHTGPLTPKAAALSTKVDYKKILSDEHFKIFAQLRNLRKAMAEREGIPPYGIFTNEQLADILRRPITTLAGLQELKGVGKTRADKYGKLFLEEVERLQQGVKEGEKGSD